MTTKTPVMFAIGSEEVVIINRNMHVTGPGYMFKVLLMDDGTYQITGKPRYKETIDFIEQVNNERNGQ